MLHWDKHSLVLQLQIIDDWEGSAAGFTGFFSFTRALRAEYSFACVATPSPGPDFSALLYHTHPHHDHTGIFLTLGLEPPPLHPEYCLILLLLIKELACTLTDASSVSHSR